MKQGKRIYISGLVQGVWYRAFAQDIARKLNIAGWVRNIDDGRVEILAFGEDKNMEFFLAELYKGSRGSKVESVKYKNVAWEYLVDFKII
jgi:acylphosphatase